MVMLYDELAPEPEPIAPEVPEIDRRVADPKICQECGKCCTQLSVGVHLPPKMRELFLAHYGRDVLRARFTVHHRCAHLDENGLCDLWKADPEKDKRPAICQEFMCEKVENPDMLVLDVDSRGWREF